MGLITKEVEIRLTGTNISLYENKGYTIPRYIDSRNRNKVKKNAVIKVKTQDLPNKAQVKVDFKCDGCGDITYGVIWGNYTRQTGKDDKYFCKKCCHTEYKKFTSFYDWCYENLPKEDADNIINRWDYELNNCSPKDISYGSKGNNRNGYWFKCDKKSYHKSELKHLASIILYKKVTCKQCESVYEVCPRLVKYFINVEDAKTYAPNSKKVVKLKCKDCDSIRTMSISDLYNHGFSCKQCGDGISYPEKFTYVLLKQLKLDFKTQTSKAVFKWCDKYRYDFYFEYKNESYIIETHGRQHYKDSSGVFIKTLKEEQDNDKLKQELALVNGINHYVVIDCMYSELEWIKNSIINSKLPNLLNFKEEDIDWLKCHEFACSSRVKEACDLWNNGVKNTVAISKIMGLGSSTIINYLKHASKIESFNCSYDPKIESKTGLNKILETRIKKVVCLTTNEVFNSITESAYKNNIKSASAICAVCKGKNKSAGKHPETGEPLKWMYLEDYNKMLEENEQQNQIAV